MKNPLGVKTLTFSPKKRFKIKNKYQLSRFMNILKNENDAQYQLHPTKGWKKV